ncbi:hypothetical protein ACFFX0_31025 [Citricoccus parietis]|uniref:Uncharacterized protein n=1 Tax=Citricoccus parietis TaxID=592307 RepID=A0ABV5GA62_9MICC
MGFVGCSARCRCTRRGIGSGSLGPSMTASTRRSRRIRNGNTLTVRSTLSTTVTADSLPGTSSLNSESIRICWTSACRRTRPTANECCSTMAGSGR